MFLVVQSLLDALPNAGLYALLGVGFVSIYKSSGVLNFAQGQLAVVGGFLFLTFEKAHAGPFGSLFLGMAVAFVVGVAAYVFVLNPLLGLGPLILVMATIALGLLFESSVAIIFGTGTQQLSLPFANNGINLPGGLSLTTLGIATVLTALVFVLGYELLLHFTPLGLALRATSESVSLAAQRGVRVAVVTAIAWGISAVASMLGAVLYSSNVGLDPSLSSLSFAAFPAVLLGGLDSVRGALVGGLVVAYTQTLASTYLGGEVHDVIPYVILLVVLAIRPQGLFGSQDVVRV